MKKNLFIFLILFFCGYSKSDAQYTRYIIKLKNKTGTPFTIANPSQFLSQRAINRRTKYGISISESDLPINPAYIDSIRIAGNVTILNVSKWFNQVCIKTSDAAALTRINAMPFVNSSSAIGARPAGQMIPVNKNLDPYNFPIITPVQQRPLTPADVFNYGLAYNQVHLHNAEFLHNLGFKGEGMQLAIMDAGFLNYSTHSTFDSIRNNNQILGTWDFVANKASVNEEHYHGMQCLSTIAANMPGSFVGTAPKSSFYLFRTEDIGSEYPVEEQNFAAAAERADSLGVDIFSISLGYNTFDNNSFDYTYSNMDGNSTLIARAVNAAVQKGIAVIVAAGNEGNSSWHYITTPGDATDALTVGAVNTSRQPGGFSSFGPNSAGKIKPDVAALGAPAVVANINTGLPTYNNGTSFACPIMAGVTSCLWQAFPEVNNKIIFESLQKSSDQYNNPNNRTGYGIPDVKKAFVALIKKLYSQQIIIDNNCSANINWNVKAAANMKFIIERKLPAELNYKAIDSQQINTSFIQHSFSFADDLSALPIGINISYRIKMQIAADTSFYLDSATVNYLQSCQNNALGITIAPNPVLDNLQVIIKRISPVNAVVLIHNNTGQLVFQSVSQSITGTKNISIPLKNFSAAVYIISVLFDNKTVMTKTILKR